MTGMFGHSTAKRREGAFAARGAVLRAVVLTASAAGLVFGFSLGIISAGVLV